MELYDRLREYVSSDFYPWHMPGHKRRLIEFDNPFSIDITEIDGFDDLHHPEGILKDAMEEAAAIYGSEKTYFLVNGSSCGILAAISAAVKPGGKLLMARNCHKSAYHGALLQQAEVIYLYPKLEKEGFYGAVQDADVEAALKENPEICAVMLVSPGYEGVVSDIKAIAQTAHAYGCALLVDEAHGAHFPFASGFFPASALDKGADVVIQSLHKTLPSLTQTALLHLGKGSSARLRTELVELYLRIYQSSSPSYILMASIDRCIHLMAGDAGKQLMAEYVNDLFTARSCLRERLQTLKLYEPEQMLDFYDPSKFVIVIPESGSDGIEKQDGPEKNLKEKVFDIRLDGNWLAQTLRCEYHLEPEMNTDRYLILMSSPADTEEGFRRMVKALLEIDQQLKDRIGMQSGNVQKKQEKQEESDTLKNSGIQQDEKELKWAKLPRKAPENVMKSAVASAMNGEWIPVSQAMGRICHDFIYIYPPGIPLLVPGERIGKKELDVIGAYRIHGLKVHGVKEEDTICCVCE